MRKRITKSTIDTCLEKYGVEKQLSVVIEELAELQKELCKFLRGKRNNQQKKKITEEMADAYVVLDGLTHIMENEKEIDEVYNNKVRRLKWRFKFVGSSGREE